MAKDYSDLKDGILPEYESWSSVEKEYCGKVLDIDYETLQEIIQKAKLYDNYINKNKGVVAPTTGGSEVIVTSENAAKVEVADDNT